MSFFYNLTNHPFSKWSEEQVLTAHGYGDIVDIGFPQVPADPELDIELFTNEWLDSQPLNFDQFEDNIFLVQGEAGVQTELVYQIQNRGGKVVHTCSERIIEEKVQEDGSVKKFQNFNLEDSDHIWITESKDFIENESQVSLRACVVCGDTCFSQICIYCESQYIYESNLEYE